MSAVTQTQFACDVRHCDERRMLPGMTEAREAADLLGWTKDGDVDLCPFHSRPGAMCRATVGSGPGWMNSDQYDAVACKCDAPPNHDGPCQCEHTRAEQP